LAQAHRILKFQDCASTLAEQHSPWKGQITPGLDRTMAHSLALASSEPECDETVDLVAEHAPISREVRSAYRHAAAALAVSGLVFVAALALVLFSPAQDRAVTSGVAGSIVGLDQVAPAPGALGSFAMLKDSLNDMGEDFTIPSRYRLVSPATLRGSIGITAPAIQELPTGTQVFPLKNSMDWVQVIVPKGEGPNGVAAAFGWLPVKEHGAELLEKDKVMPSDMLQRRTVTQEEMSKQWGEVRAKNAELKNSLSHMQDSMRANFANKMKLSKQRQAAGAMPAGNAPASAASGVTAAGTNNAPLVAQQGPGAVFAAPSSTSSVPEQPADMQELSAAANDAVDVQELKKDASAIQSDVRNELKEPPKQILHDLSNVFR